MSPAEQAAYDRATALFRQALKVDAKAIHRDPGRAPTGKGWVPCRGANAGLFHRPDTLREALALFQQAYETHPGLVAINQIALRLEMLGETDRARAAFEKMAEQARREDSGAYVRAAQEGIARLSAATA